MKKLFLIGLFYHMLSNAGMIMHEYFVDKFTNDPVPTEYTTYQLLKRKPLENEKATYCAVSWSFLINNKKLHLLEGLRFNGGFTVCQHVGFEQIIPVLKKIGIDVLFSPHVDVGKKYDGIKVIPFPQFPVNGADPASKKDIFYSFVGAIWRPSIREKIMELPRYEDVYVKERQQWHFWDVDKEKHKHEYQDVLARSRYSLCPRGVEISTVRFWESLQAGAIPVLFGRQWVLPETFDWKSCVVFVEEEDIENLYDILKAIPAEREMQMRANCIKAHKQFSKDNFVSVIRHYYDDQRPE